MMSGKSFNVANCANYVLCVLFFCASWLPVGAWLSTLPDVGQLPGPLLGKPLLQHCNFDFTT